MIPGTDTIERVVLDVDLNKTLPCWMMMPDESLCPYEATWRVFLRHEVACGCEGYVFQVCDRCSVAWSTPDFYWHCTVCNRNYTTGQVVLRLERM